MYLPATTVYTDGNIIVECENEEDVLDGVFIHTKIEHITPSLLKKYKKVFNEIIIYLDSIGIHNVYATPLEDKDEKWERVFGFKWTGLYLDGYKLMKYAR